MEKEEEKEAMRFLISESEETDFVTFLSKNQEQLASKGSPSISSVKKLFNILDAHLDIYCWLLKKEVGVAALMELEQTSALHSHILEQPCASVEDKICQVLGVFVEVINRKKKFRMWFKSFDRICDVLKYGERMGSLDICLELISCSIVIEYDEQQCEYRQLFSEY